MARLLFISSAGDFLPIARRCKEEGNEVAIWVKSARARAIGLYRGLLDDDEMPDTLQAAFEKLDYEPDAVIIDHIGMGDLADELRQHGLPVFGASRIADKLEQQRAFGLQVMQRAGIQIPLTSPALSTVAEAQQFMRQHPQISRWVVKFEGDNAPRSTVIGTADEVTDALDSLLSEAEGTRFVVQQFVDGVEISTEVWVRNGEILYPANATLETKRYLSGDLGPNTGCMTSIVWCYEAEQPRIVQEGIGKMAELLSEWGYSGPIDLNTIVNENGVWGLEWTPRYGYNAIYALLELADDDISALLIEAAAGQSPTLPFRTDEVAYAIRVYLPPSPFTDYIVGDLTERLKQLERRGEDVKAIAEALNKVGIEVGFKRGTGELVGAELKEVAAGEQIIVPDLTLATVWLLDVKVDQQSGKMVTAGLDGIICEVSAARERLSDAVRACEETVNAIRLAGKCWRNDGHLRAFDAAKLVGMGYEIAEGVLR
jgi:phosphoribosylamine--glycine ligase